MSVPGEHLRRLIHQRDSLRDHLDFCHFNLTNGQRVRETREIAELDRRIRALRSEAA